MREEIYSVFDIQGGLCVRRRGREGTNDVANANSRRDIILFGEVSQILLCIGLIVLELSQTLKGVSKSCNKGGQYKGRIGVSFEIGRDLVQVVDDVGNNVSIKVRHAIDNLHLLCAKLCKSY